MAEVKQFQGGTAPLVEDQGDGTHVPLVKVLGGGLTGSNNVSLTRAWDASGLLATDTAKLAGSSVTYTRTITVSAARDLSTWTAISAWASSDASAVPANLLSWSGDPLTLDGLSLTFSF